MPLRHHSASDVNYAWVPPTQSRESIHEWCLTMCSRRGTERTRLHQEEEEEKVWDCVSSCLCSPLRQPLTCSLCNADEIHHHTAQLRRMISFHTALVLKHWWWTNLLSTTTISYTKLFLKHTAYIQAWFFPHSHNKQNQWNPYNGLQGSVCNELVWGKNTYKNSHLQQPKAWLIKIIVYPKIITLSSVL